MYRPAGRGLLRPWRTSAGDYFDNVGDNPADQMTRDDLLAVALRDISWKLLGVWNGPDQELLTDLLAVIGA